MTVRLSGDATWDASFQEIRGGSCCVFGRNSGEADHLVQSQMLSLKIRVGMSLELQEDLQGGAPEEMLDVVGFVAFRSTQTNKVPYHPSR